MSRSFPPKLSGIFPLLYEKLDELRELCCLAELADYSCDRRYLQNQELFQTSELRTDTEVQKQVAALTESDFTRRVPRKERQATQKELLNLPLLPTTTIGSFPQTKEVKQNRTKFRKGEISEEEYRNNAKGFIRDCIALQENFGLDVLVHGEFETQRHGGIFWRKSVWLCVYHRRLGTVLRYTGRKAADCVRGRQTQEVHYYRLYPLCQFPDG